MSDPPPKKAVTRSLFANVPSAPSAPSHKPSKFPPLLPYVPVQSFQRLDSKIEAKTAGKYKGTLSKFPNLNYGPQCYSVSTSSAETARYRKTNQEASVSGYAAPPNSSSLPPDARFDEADDPFHCPPHYRGLLTSRRLSALASCFLQVEVMVQSESDEYRKRQKEISDVSEAARKEAAQVEQDALAASKRVVRGKHESDDDDDDDTDDTDDDDKNRKSKKKEEEKARKAAAEAAAQDPKPRRRASVAVNSDSDDDLDFDEDCEIKCVLPFTEGGPPPPVVSQPLAFVEFTLKCAMPPCCMSGACEAKAKGFAPAIVPTWVQKEWDKEEAVRLADAMFGTTNNKAPDATTNKAASEGDREAFIDFDKELDFGPGKVPTRHVSKLVSVVGEKMSRKDLDALSASLDVDGGVTWPAFLSWWHVRLLSRKVWGKRVAATDVIPLPRCCKNAACKAHVERPNDEDDDDEEKKQHHIMWSVFARHDEDGSGELTITEVRLILEEHEIVFDEAKLQNTFNKYDLDRSHALEFEEFCSLMVDLDASSQIVAKRSNSYALPDHMTRWFPQSKIDEFIVQFGMFDDNGDGTVDSRELRAVLTSLGIDATVDQVLDIVKTVDTDGSGVIEFPEFISLMRKIETGECEVGTSGFAQAIMSSKPAVRLRKEVAELNARKINNVSISVLKKPLRPPTAEVIIDGAPGSPYEGHFLKLHVAIPDDYPFSPPKVRFTHRILHVNVDMLLDGTCTIPQILKMWDGGWDLRMVLTYVRDLLSNPDTRLMPQIMREKWGLPGFTAEDLGLEDLSFQADDMSVSAASSAGGSQTTASTMQRSSLGFSVHGGSSGGSSILEDGDGDGDGLVPFSQTKTVVEMYGGKPIGPPYPVAKSKPEDDFRDSGERHGGSFFPRIVEMYMERRPKFNAEARNICLKECQKIGKVDKNVIVFS